jgi:adenosylmethionine-8-amino-7-oxononanoate aminotransferase
MGDTIGLCPPLIITEGECDELVKRLTRAFDETLAYVKDKTAA